MWIQNHIHSTTLWSVRKVKKSTILFKLRGLHPLQLFRTRRVISFRESQRIKSHRFMNNRQEHLINDVLRTDWEYRVNLPLWDKEPKRHELERLVSRFMVHLNRKIYTTKELRKGQQVQCFPVLEKEYKNPHHHILLKVSAGSRLVNQPNKTYFIKQTVLKIISSLNLVNLDKVDPKNIKTFQVLYDAIGAVGYNLKDGIEQIDFTNISLTNKS